MRQQRSGLWARVARAAQRVLGWAEKRAVTSVPWDQGGPNPRLSPERALSLVPLFACVRLLADNIASLPIQAYRRVGERRDQLPSLPALIAEPAAVDDVFMWIHKAVVSLALRGNAYGLVTQRDGFEFPTMVEWLHPDEVFVDEQRPTLPVYYVLGSPVPTDSIVHIPWMVQPGRVVGLSPVAAFAATIGVGLSATEYGQSWFESGGAPTATMKNSQQTLDPADADEVSNRLAARMRKRKPLVYGRDWDFNMVNINAEEAQFLETMQLNATQIAAIYGIPPEKVGGQTGSSLTYSTVELNQLDLATSTLRPWLVRLETALSGLLPQRQFVRFNADAMIRTSLLDRYRAHQIALASGWRNADEVRALEDLPPLPNGQGQAYKPVAGAEPEPEPDPAPGNEQNQARLNGHALARGAV